MNDVDSCSFQPCPGIPVRWFHSLRWFRGRGQVMALCSIHMNKDWVQNEDPYWEEISRDLAVVSWVSND